MVVASDETPVWVEWVDGARRNDAAAREELISYFTPFVHAVLVCHVATHLANERLKPVLDEALTKLAEVTDSAQFSTFLLEHTRKKAISYAKSPGSTLEMLGGGPVITEGKKVLSKLRALPEPMRERLVFRLLEGITGAEIAEATRASESDVRADLERGLSTVVRDLGHAPVSAAGDTYLWSLVGAPHASVVPLENQLTPLRYEPSTADSLMTEAIGVKGIDPDVTPVQGPSPLEKKTEGRRPTSELRTVVPITAPPVDDSTTPSGEKLVEETTSVMDAPPPRAPPVDAAGGNERTQHVTDLPVAATPANPFAEQPGTIPVSDLPAAAGIDRASRPRLEPEVTRAAEPSVPDGAVPAPHLRPRSQGEGLAAVTRRLDSEKPPDPDSTEPRGVPVSILSDVYQVPTRSQPANPPEQDWRTAIYDAPKPAPAPPQPFSFTRGATPFILAAVLFAFFGAVAYVNVLGIERDVRRGWNLVPIAVAAQDLREGQIIDYDLISVRQVPEQFVTASVVRPDSTPYVLNQRILVPVQAGDPILWTQFDSARSGARLSQQLRSRQRAYTFEAKNLVAVGGWVRPGDHVDIVLTLRDPGTLLKSSLTVLQNVPVIATGKLIATTNTSVLKPNQLEYSNVSVVLQAEEIEMLALVRELAQSYKLVLRTEDDPDVLDKTQVTTLHTLLDGKRHAAIEHKRYNTIQTIRSAPKQDGRQTPPVIPPLK